MLHRAPPRGALRGAPRAARRVHGAAVASSPGRRTGAGEASQPLEVSLPRTRKAARPRGGARRRVCIGRRHATARPCCGLRASLGAHPGPSAAVGRWCAPRERAEAFGAAPLAPLDEPRRLRAARRGRAGPQRDAPSAGALGVLCRGSRAAGRRRGAWAARAARVRLGRAEGPAEAAGGAAQRDTCARACASD